MFNPSIQISVDRGASVGGTRTCFAENGPAGELEGQGSAARTMLHHAVRYTVIHGCTTILLSTHLCETGGCEGNYPFWLIFWISFDSDNLVNDRRFFLGASTINQLRFATLLRIEHLLLKWQWTIRWNWQLPVAHSPYVDRKILFFFATQFWTICHVTALMVLFHRCPWKMRLATRAFAASRGGWSFVKLPFGSRNSATVHKVVIQKISFPFFQNRPKHMCIIYIYYIYIYIIHIIHICRWLECSISRNRTDRKVTTYLDLHELRGVRAQ